MRILKTLIFIMLLMAGSSVINAKCPITGCGQFIECIEQIHFTCNVSDIKDTKRHRLPITSPIKGMVDKEQTMLYINFIYPLEDAYITLKYNGIEIISDAAQSDEMSFEYDLSEYGDGEYDITVSYKGKEWIGKFTK